MRQTHILRVYRLSIRVMDMNQANARTQPNKHAYSPDECVGIKVNELMFLNRTTKKQLGEVLGISGPTAGRKIRGEISWSLSDLYRVADFFEVDIIDLLPHRVTQTQETPDSLSRTEGSNLVAGVGFEPTTSGL